MPRIMAQEQSSGVRRRSLESAMKEPQARTKVVLRHLPPTISQALVLEHIHSKYAERYTWFNFHPGKSSHKRQVFSRAYINFKKSEDVYDFFEDFDGHIFVNERGTQCKASVEYAPYQRVPKPRSKKDVREGTILKDPDYLDFLEMLGKPTEFLPSAEVQLERREAEKAAAIAAGGAKEAVVVTPLMEFVRQKRAAKSTPQRSLSSKLASRSGVTSASLNLASHKRGLERSRSGPLMYPADNSMSILAPKEAKELPSQILGSRREDQQQQRKDRELVNERRKKELVEGKEKKVIREVSSPSIFLAKGSPGLLRLDGKDRNAGVSSKDTVDLSDAGEAEFSSSHGPVRGKAGSNEGISGEGTKELNKRDGLRRKQLLLSKEKFQKDHEAGPGSPGVSPASGSSYSQRHRPPVSPRVNSPGALLQQGSSSLYATTSGDGSTPTGLSKSGHRREVTGRNSRGGLSPRDHVSAAQQLASSQVSSASESYSQIQQSVSQSERGGKRPPRPQSARASGKDQVFAPAFPSESDIVSSTADEKVSNASVKESYSSGNGNDKQDSRRVRNKDRPDRPVWTPRRRSDTAPISDPSSNWVVSETCTSDSGPPETASGGLPTGAESIPKQEKADKGAYRQAGKGTTSVESGTGEGKASAQAEGGRSQTVYGPSSNSGPGKVRYVESSTTRSSRGARYGGGIVLSIQARASTTQAELKVDASPTAGDSKTHSSPYQEKENGESDHFSTIRKQDSSPAWNEIPGGGHRSGSRRERGLQQGSKDADIAVAGVEVTKPLKRSGSLPPGSNEKQVWVAVQKSIPGT